MPLRPEQEYSEYTSQYVNWNGLIEELKACINAVGGASVANQTQYEDSWRGVQLALSQLRSQLLTFSAQVSTNVGAAQALLSQKGQPNGIASLGPDGRLIGTQSPLIYPDNTIAKSAPIPTPQVLPLAVGWSAFGSGYALPKYSKSDGITTIKGVLTKTTAPALLEAIATLPLSCCPIENEIFPCTSYSGGALQTSSFYIESSTGKVGYNGFSTYVGGVGTYFCIEASFLSPAYALFFGDSITFGVGASSNANRYSTKLAQLINLAEDNQGVSGTPLQNSAPILANNAQDSYPTRVVSRFPSRVYILYGLNDILYNSASFSVDNFINGYRQIIQGLLNAGISARDIYIGSPPYVNPDAYATASPPANAGNVAKHLQYRDATRTVANIYGCNWVDIYQGMKDGGGNSLLTSGDPFHPNDSGHQLIANLFAALK